MTEKKVQSDVSEDSDMVDRKKGSGHKRVNSVVKIPINMELLSNDNRVGVLLAVGCGLGGIGFGDWLGWGHFFQSDGWGVVLVRPLMMIFGTVLAVLCGQRLLVPGCRPLLRINFGGVTDVRLVTAPIRWSLIQHARRPEGIWFYLLPGVILEMNAEYHTSGLETWWSRLIHLPNRLLGGHMLFLECGTLDQTPDQALQAIRSHLDARPGSGRR